MLVLAMSLSLFLRKKTNIQRGLLTCWNKNALVRERRGPLRQGDASYLEGGVVGVPQPLLPKPRGPEESLA